MERVEVGVGSQEILWLDVLCKWVTCFVFQISANCPRNILWTTVVHLVSHKHCLWSYIDYSVSFLSQSSFNEQVRNEFDTNWK